LKFLKQPGTIALMERYGFAIPKDAAAAHDSETAAH
jgi:hypothetical protein